MVLQAYINPQLENILISLLYLLGFFIAAIFFSKKIKQVFEGLGKLRALKKYSKELEEIGGISEIFVKYLLYFLGIILALLNLGIDVVNVFAVEAIEAIPNLVIAFSFILIGFFIANISSKIGEDFLKNKGLDDLFSNLDFSASSIIGKLIYYFVLLISIIIALTQLGLRIELIAWLTVGIVLSSFIFLLFLIYGMVKDYLKDFFAGILIRQRKYFRIGEYILVDGKKLRVMRIGILFTQLKGNGRIIIKRNSFILENLDRFFK